MSSLFLVGGTGFFPPLVIPFGITTLYTAQKFLNSTIYKSYKDIAFITQQKKGKIKIFQDVIRPDIYYKTHNMNNKDKASFLQLQTLICLAKLDECDKFGLPQNIEIDTHSILRSTLKRLDKLGYLKDYEEIFLKKSKLIFPKLAFSNMDLKKDLDMYRITVQRTNKKIDFNDPELKRMFPIIFSKKGFLASKGYNIEIGKDGKPSIIYKKKSKDYKSSGKKTEKQSNRKDFLDSIKTKPSLTYDEEKNIDNKSNIKEIEK